MCLIKLQCILRILPSETVHLWYCLHLLEHRFFARTLMGRYFDLNQCDKSTFPVITLSRNIQCNCPPSTTTVSFISILIEGVSSVAKTMWGKKDRTEAWEDKVIFIGGFLNPISLSHYMSRAVTYIIEMSLEVIFTSDVVNAGSLDFH